MTYKLKIDVDICCMFTGIIESIGEVFDILHNESNISFWVKSAISTQLKIDQSLSHNGVCLTVEAINNDQHKVTAIAETLQKTNLGKLKKGDKVNLERCLTINGRLDGHFVQGHIDATVKCIKTLDKNGSWEFCFEYNSIFSNLIIEKGSICLNGISLTCYNITNNTFCVAIIPYTYNNTNICHVQVNDVINVEFDILGKYINRRLET